MANAEYSIEEWRERLDVFLPAFNEAHGTTYETTDLMIDETTGLPWNADESSDVTIENATNGRLRVQWTLAATEPSEWINPKLADAVIVALSKALDQSGLRGFGASISIDNVPRAEADQLALADALFWLIRDKALDHVRASNTAIFVFNAADLDYPISIIRKHCSRVAIYKANSPDVPTSKLLSWSAGGGRAMPTVDERIRVAVEKKIARYGASAHDLVLVVEVTKAPFSSAVETAWMRQAVGADPGAFRSIWALRMTLVPDASAVRLHP